MEHKISALIDIRIETYRHALFRHYAIACENYTNAMYYQFLYLDAWERFADIKKTMSQKEQVDYHLACACLDYRNP